MALEARDRLAELPVTAERLVGPLSLSGLQVAHARPLSTLAEQYGQDWTNGVLRTWSGHLGSLTYADDQESSPWWKSLVPVCEAKQQG